MYDSFFKESLRKIYCKKEVLIKGVYHKQTTHTGAFMSHGWLDAMDIKLDVILGAIEDNKDSIFIFADCDIQFFKPFKHLIVKELENNDIVCQEDRGSMCAGFFGCRSNYKTKKLFEDIKANFRNMVNDQVALNHYKECVKYKLLDRDLFYTIGNHFSNPNGTYIWDNKTNIIPPSNIVLHHANYVVGVDNKLKLMEMIRANEGLV
jgi:hypothetical protein